MKKKGILKRVIAGFLALMLIFTIALPLTKIEVKAASTSYSIVPTSTVAVSKLHANATLASAIFKGISLTINGLGAIQYATENNKDGNFKTWTKLALAYFSGNADQNEQISDLKNAMLEEFKMTKEAIAALSVQIEALQADINKLSNALSRLEDQTKAAELKTRLDNFYTNFFEPSYTRLIDAYNAVELTINSSTTNDTTVRMKMDDLYMAAAKMSELESYITGKKFFDEQSILDVYFDYTLLANGVKSTSDDGY